MVSTIKVQVAFQGEFKQLLTRFGIGDQAAQNIITKVWPTIEEALVDQEINAMPETFDLKEEIAKTVASIEQQLVNMSEEEREVYIAQCIAEMDPELREGLERSQGKWAEDTDLAIFSTRENGK